jgi:hypothetical protein
MLALQAGKQPREAVYCDEPAVKRIQPWQLMLAPGWTDSDLIDECPYVVYCEVLPLDEAKRNPRWQGVDKLKGERRYQNEEVGLAVDTREEELPDDCKYVKVLHYYERRRRIHCIFAKEKMDAPLLVEKWPWPFDGYPFELILIHDVPDEEAIAQPSSVDLLRPMQDSLNQLRSLTQNHIEQYTAKWQTRQGWVTPSARRQLKASRRGMLVEHNAPSAEGLVPLQVPAIPPDLYRLNDENHRDIDYVSGVSAYMRGMQPEGGRRTATEAVAIQQTGATNVDSDVIAYSKFLARIAKKVLALLQKYAVRTQTIPIYDERTATQMWANFNVEAIRGEYDLTVKVGSTRAINQEAERQNYLFLLQTLTPYAQVPNPMTGMPLINIAALVKKIVELFGLPNASEVLNEMPAPMMDPMAGGLPAESDPLAMLGMQMQQ